MNAIKPKGLLIWMPISIMLSVVAFVVSVISINENEGILTCLGLGDMIKDPLRWASLLTPFGLFALLVFISLIIDNEHVYIKVITIILIFVIALWLTLLPYFSMENLTTQIPLNREPSRSEEAEVYSKTQTPMFVGYSLGIGIKLVAVVPKNERTNEVVEILIRHGIAKMRK